MKLYLHIIVPNSVLIILTPFFVATVAIATLAIMASSVLSKVKLSKIRDLLGGRSNNREVLGVNRRLLDDPEARVNLRVTFILLLFRNIIGRGRLTLIDDVTVNVFLFTGS